MCHVYLDIHTAGKQHAYLKMLCLYTCTHAQRPIPYHTDLDALHTDKHVSIYIQTIYI